MCDDVTLCLCVIEAVFFRRRATLLSHDTTIFLWTNFAIASAQFDLSSHMTRYCQVQYAPSHFKNFPKILWFVFFLQCSPSFTQQQSLSTSEQKRHRYSCNFCECHSEPDYVQTCSTVYSFCLKNFLIVNGWKRWRWSQLFVTIWLNRLTPQTWQKSFASQHIYSTKN